MRLETRVSVSIAVWFSIALVAGAAVAATFAYAVSDPPWAASIEFPLIASAAALLLSVFLAVGVGRMASLPYGRVVLAARRFAAGDVSARVRARGGEPAAEGLAGSINEALDAAAARIAAAEASGIDRSEELTAALAQIQEQEEHRRRDARMASRMQRRIVPKPEDLPNRAELAFQSVYAPAENTGGDFFDAVRAGKNGCALVAADVSGRGVTAALIAALVKTAFRSRATWGADAASVLREVNEELLPIMGGSDHFVTAFFGLLDLESGKLVYALAGHPPAMLLRRREATVINLEAEGPSLGVLDEAEYTGGEIVLEEGDRILLYTDGVSGARNYRGEAFGRERLAKVLAATGPISLTQFPPTLASELETFTVGAPRGDDIVVLACEFVAHARDEGLRRRPSGGGEDYRTLARRGAALASSGQIEEAIRAYERVLVLEPEDVKALNNLGTLYWKVGRREDAAGRFREAARLDPADPRIARNLRLAERPGAPGTPGGPAG